LDQFSIVFVCSGNRFRSPLAEAFVRRLTLGLPVNVSSFGTLELGAAPALAEAAELGVWHGVDLSTHRARQIAGASIEDADVVIGFDQEHIRRAVIDGRAPSGRSFTFRELVSLLEDVEEPETADVVERARQMVREAIARRDADPDALKPEPFGDPFGKSWRVYREAAAEIRELALKLVTALFGVTREADLPVLAPDVGKRRLRRGR
jgi:protein-tyrosine phosphatase